MREFGSALPGGLACEKCISLALGAEGCGRAVSLAIVGVAGAPIAARQPVDDAPASLAAHVSFLSWYVRGTHLVASCHILAHLGASGNLSHIGATGAVHPVGSAPTHPAPRLMSDGVSQ